MRLTIQVANFLHAAGGLRDVPTFGKEPIVWRDYLIHSTAAVGALAFLFGVVTLLLLGYSLNRKDYRSHYMIGFAFVMVIHALNGDVRLGRELFESYGFLPQAKLNMFILPFGAAMLLLYVATWFSPGRLRQGVQYTAAALVGWSVLFMILPLSLAVRLYYINLQVTAALAVSLLILMAYALRKGRGEIWILAAGTGFLALGVLAAVLRTLHLIEIQGLEFIGFMLFLATQTSQSVVELTRIRRGQQALVRENKAALSRLSLFVPRVHLSKVSRRWREPIKPGKFYNAEACIMFLRIEPDNGHEMTADDLFDLHADFAEEVANFAERFGGVVDRISVGRYILSFNDDPAIALQLAVQLRIQVRQWGAALDRYILFRCGIHYGSAVWGLYGSAERWAGGYMGDTVNVAARLETLCARYHTSILMSQDAYFQSAHFDEYLTRMLEPVKLKGKDDHIFVYEVLAGLPDDRIEFIKETLPFFGRGLQAFLNKDFTRAIEYFEKVIALHPEDFAANLYLGRSKKLAEQGTDETWNPIESLQKK
jgi:class 3 adenylate cyclase